MANTYLERTFGSAGNRKTFTISTWLKRNQLGGGQSIFHGEISGSTNGEQDDFYFGNDYLLFGGWNSNYITSTALYRDVSAWYHIVLSVDTTQATSSNRIKLYVNGVEQARSEGTGYPAQNFDTAFIKAGTYRIAGNSGASGYGNYTLSHFHYIDGTAYDPTAFGEYDANGVWKIKTSPSVTYGVNGFFILKDGNSVTDQSGNGNNFTVGGGTLTKTEDSPSNVFATMNPLYRTTNVTFSNGNNTITSSSSSWNAPASTLAVSTGKWYAEGKATGYNHNAVGVTSNPNGGSVGYPFEIVGGYGYKFYSGGKTTMGADDVAYGNTLANGDIFQIALDLDNSKIYFGKNGTWQNSGVPTSGSTGTGAAFTLPSGETYHFVNALNSQSGGASSQWNFGNGYFGTTAVASAGTNASGIGIFEYDVPTGYTALSTKGLNL